MGFPLVGGWLAIDVLNTVIARDGEAIDLLGSARDVARWVAAVTPPGLPPERARPWGGEPRALRAFRESLRRGLRAWADGRVDIRLLRELNRHLARDPKVATVRPRGAGVVVEAHPTAGPRARLYGAVARSAAELLASGDRRRFRKCANPACRLVFYDVSKAGRRRWCSMDTCGAQSKMRAYRRR